MLNEANVLNLIQDWVSRGLVAPEHQATLVTDVRRLQHGVAAPAVAVKTTPARRINPLVVTIAVVCGLLGLALLAQLAANWQDIPRLVRVLVLCCGLVVLYGGAGWRRHKVGTEDAVVHGLACLGTVMYGTALLLVSQMFHIGGTAVQWLLLWMAGAFLTALAFSSRPVLVLTTVLAGFWGGCLIFPQGMDKSLAPLTDYIWQYPAVLLLLFLPARRWHCATARVLLFLLAGLWAMTVLGQVITTWNDLSKGLRLTLLLLVLLALYGRMGWFLRKGDTVKTHAFAVLGNLFYGVVLVLVGRMFSLGGTVPDLLLLWWLGVFAMTLALSSRALLFFALILSGGLGQHLWFNFGTPGFSMTHLWLFMVTLPLFAGAAWHLRLRIPAAPKEIQSVMLSLLYGGLLFGGAIAQIATLSRMSYEAGMIGWLLPWLVGSYVIALLTSSRITFGLTIFLAAAWGYNLVIQDGVLSPFTSYAGQWLPALLLLLGLVLRWRSPVNMVLWQILLLGWLDILLWYGGYLDPAPVRVGAVILLHLAAATMIRLLPERWDDLKRGCLHFNLWVAVSVTFIYALGNSLSQGRTLGRVILNGDGPIVPTVLLLIGTAAVAGGLVILWRRRQMARLVMVLWGLPLFFVVMLLSYPFLQPMVSAEVYKWLTAVLVLGLLIMLLLREAVKNHKSTMILCSLLLIATCIMLYVAWSFSSSALLFLLVGASLLVGMKMVRRARG